MRPEQKEYEDLKWFLNVLKRAEDYCRPYFDRAKRHYRLYRWGSAIDDKDWPYVNRSRTQDILAFVEDSSALIVQTLFAVSPFFSMLPRQTSIAAQMYGNDIDFELIGRQVERGVDYIVSHEDTEYFEETVDCFKGSGIYGNSYQGVFPKKDSILPLIKTIDFWDILPVPTARRLTKARGVFYREWMTMEDLEANAGEGGIYSNLDKIKASTVTPGTPEKDWHKTLLQEVGMSDYDTEDDDIEIFHYFTGGHVVTIADRKVIIRDTRKPDPQTRLVTKPYPYDHPIVQYKYMPVPIEFFAMGIPEILEFLQEDDNLIRSARRDNIDLCIQKIIKARENVGLNYQMVGKFFPGAIWEMPNLNDVEEFDIKDVTQSSYMETDLRKHEKENALSLFGYARGMTPEHQEQPHTVMRLQQASLNRTDLNVKLAEFGFLQNIAMRIILHMRQNISQPEYEAIVGEKDAGFYTLSAEHIRRFYLIKPVGSSVSNIKEIKQAQVQFALDTVAGVPPETMINNVRPFQIDWYALLRRALEAGDMRNIDEILKLMPPEVAQQIQQQQQQAQTLETVGEMLPMVKEVAELAQIGYGEKS